MKITNKEELIRELLNNPIHKYELHDMLNIYLDDSDRLRAYTDAVNERLESYGNKPFNPLREVPTEDLQQELENRGYHTNNMWQLDDVETKIEEYNQANHSQIVADDTTKMEILISAFENEATFSQIWDSIEQAIEDKFTPEEEL